MTAVNTSTGTSFQLKPCLILTDSLGVNLNYIYKADIITKRGYSIDDLSRLVSRLDINKYTCIILLIGTNDLTDKQIWFQYLKNKGKLNFRLQPHPTTDVYLLKIKFTKLIDLLKSKNPNIKIELSPIIPRPFDYDVNLNYLKAVNNMLQELCKSKNCYHDRTLITSFLKSGKPDNKLFFTDGLHLSQQGTDKLIRIFRLKTAKLIQRPAAASVAT